MAKTQGKQTVEVTPDAKAALEAVAGWSGLPQKLIVQRLLEWLSALDHDTQGAIIGALPQSRRPDFARMLLDQMAGPIPLRNNQREAAKSGPRGLPPKE